MSACEVKVSDPFWLTAKPLRQKYTHDQFVEIINIVKAAIRELAEKDYVDENGWNEHRLVKRLFADGSHFEFISTMMTCWLFISSERVDGLSVWSASMITILFLVRLAEMWTPSDFFSDYDV